MLSRVANSIYWMNRYMERVENYARFVGVNFNLALDLPPDVDEQWEPLLIATADHFLFYKYYDKPTKEDVIHFMTFDKRNPNSIISCLYEARENARTIRETISKEMWESINTFYLAIKGTSPDDFRNMDHMQSYFTDIRKNCQLFHGVVDSSITRNEAWHFGRLGRHSPRIWARGPVRKSPVFHLERGAGRMRPSDRGRGQEKCLKAPKVRSARPT